MPRARRVFRILAYIALGLALVISAAFGFCMSSSDIRCLQEFSDASRRWQSNPDYREVTKEYVALGAEAMQTRAWWIRSGTVIMAARSLPGLPATLAAGPGSNEHYVQFGR